MDVLIREVTTVGGIVNLMGAAALVRFFPGATVLDRILAAVLVLSTKNMGRSNPLFEVLVKRSINHLLTPLSGQRGNFFIVFSCFIVYNAVCIFLVEAGTT